jgi:hypothetical protein
VSLEIAFIFAYNGRAKVGNEHLNGRKGGIK